MLDVHHLTCAIAPVAAFLRQFHDFRAIVFDALSPDDGTDAFDLSRFLVAGHICHEMFTGPTEDARRLVLAQIRHAASLCAKFVRDVRYKQRRIGCYAEFFASIKGECSEVADW